MDHMEPARDVDLDGQEIATAIALEFQVSEQQILKFSTYVRRDDTLPSINAALDKIMAAGERQKNKAMLAKYEQNVAKLERDNRMAKAQLAEAERRHGIDKARRLAEAAEYQLQINKIIENDQMQFAGSGKRGDYKPSQEANKHISPLRTMLARIEPDQVAQDGVRAETVKNVEDNIRSNEVNIAEFNLEIARLQGLLAEA